MEYVYAFDLSLNSTGLCLFTNDGQFVRIMTIDTHKEINTPKKLKLIGKKCLEVISEYPPKIIVMEEGFTRFNKSTQAIFRVHGLINYLFSDYEQEYIPATTVKKIVGGKGNMSKTELQKIISWEYPDVKFENCDESDAFAVGLAYFLQERGRNAEKNNTK